MEISSITFALGCPLNSWIIQRVNRRLIIFISLIIWGFTNLMNGEKKYCGIENG